MVLSKEQIQKVERYLDAKKIEYVDVRFEVLDHIVSDIETIIEKESLDFQTTFYKVTSKWNEHLKETFSWVFGIAYSAPKIVIEKAKKQFQKWLFLMALTYFIPYILIDKMNFVFSKQTENNLNLFFQIMTVVSVVFFTCLLVKKSKDKAKSTYSFIVSTQSLNILIGAIVLIDFDFFDKSETLDSFQIGLLAMFIFSTYSYFYFYKKHKRAIEKYQIS